MLASKPSRAKYPLATISAYGPDNTRATKLVVGILRRAGQKYPSEMRSWSTDAGDVRNDRLIATEVADWLRSQGIKDTLNYDRIRSIREHEFAHSVAAPFWRRCAPLRHGVRQFGGHTTPIHIGAP